MRLLSLGLLLIPALAAADSAKDKDKKAQGEPMPPPVAPAEVKATVDAFKGNWTFDAELTLPGATKSDRFKLSFNCKEVAGKTAVACESKGKSLVGGSLDALFVIAYDPYSKAVHFIGVTNSYEVHDHVCHWKGADLTCAPLKAGTGPGGDEITEDVAMRIEKTAATFSSTTHLKGGATVKFEGKGKK